MQLYKHTAGTDLLSFGKPFVSWGIVGKFNARDAISFFLQLGVYSKNRNGYIYPNSDQASAVLDALRMELRRLNVNLCTGVHCREILPGKKGFRIRTDKETYRADRVILCAGSKRRRLPVQTGYDLAKTLGHRIIPVLPALVQLRCDGSFFKQIAGVRANGTVSVFADGECLARDTGEIQLTNYGISGIPVFQVSRYASRALYEKKDVEAVLDFMPDFTDEQMLAFLKARAAARPDKTGEEFLIGLFHKKIIRSLDPSFRDSPRQPCRRSLRHRTRVFVQPDQELPGHSHRHKFF